MFLCIRRVPERVEAAGPRSDVAGIREHDEGREGRERRDSDECANEHFELLRGHVLADKLGQGDELEKTKHA